MFQQTKSEIFSHPFAPVSLRREIAVAAIEVWGIEQVVAYLQSLPPEEKTKSSMYNRPQGFDLFSDRFISRKWDYKNNIYPDPLKLPKWQRQEYGGCWEFEFDRALICRVGPLLTGILYCQWSKQNQHNPDKSYWGYNLCFVDVHICWQGIGIATKLLGALEEQSWLKGKILVMSKFTKIGQNRLHKTVDRELKAEGYILLPPNYCWIELPTEAGIWDTPKIRGTSAMSLEKMSLEKKD